MLHLGYWNDDVRKLLQSWYGAKICNIPFGLKSNWNDFMEHHTEDFHRERSPLIFNRVCYFFSLETSEGWVLWAIHLYTMCVCYSMKIWILIIKYNCWSTIRLKMKMAVFKMYRNLWSSDIIFSIYIFKNSRFNKYWNECISHNLKLHII